MCTTAAPASMPGVPPQLPPTGAPAPGDGGTSSSLPGAAGQAVSGIEQLAPVLTQLTSVLTSLVDVLRGSASAPPPPPTAGGGATSQGAPPVDMPPPPPVGANGAPTASPAQGTGPSVDPSSVKDTSSTAGLTAASRRGLEEAHRFGLPLVSGKRSGGGGSDHDHGNAIDVGTLPIAAASSTGGTPQMKAFAEHMRQQGKAGRLDVKYVIADGRIASARDGWAWRPYTYPGRSAGELEALKRSDPGEYNRLQHNDHVHVSFG